MQNRVTSKKFSSAVHLKCFEPLFRTIIKAEDINSLLLSKENTKRVRNWLKFWNSRLILSVPALLSEFKIAPFFNFKTTELTKYNLPLIVSLTFLDIKEILLNFALVSKYFYSLTFNNYLWKELCFIWYKPDDVSKLIETLYRNYRNNSEEWKWKEILYLMIKHACFECRALDFEKMRICPILKRTLCEECRKKDKFRLISINEIRRDYGGYLTHFMDNFSLRFGWNKNEEKVFYKYYVEKCRKAAKVNEIKIKRTASDRI